MRANIQIGQFNSILFMQNALGLQKKEPPVGSMKTGSQQVDSLSISYALFTHFSRIGTETDILLHFSKVEKMFEKSKVYRVLSILRLRRRIAIYATIPSFIYFHISLYFNIFPVHQNTFQRFFTLLGEDRAKSD